VATVRSILTNEKYKGDALLQKRFTVDFLTKTTKVNEGEVPQYYVQHSHPAIIEPDEFNAVQAAWQTIQLQQPLLGKNRLRSVQRLLRFQGLGLQHQVSPNHMAVQRKVQARHPLSDAPPYGG
jgi:hypothetical protein